MDDSDIPDLPQRPNFIKEPAKRRRLCCKIFTTILTVPLIVLVIFQVTVGIMGARDLGGKYKSFLMLTYRVVSLMPAIAIGVYILLRLWLQMEVYYLRIFSKTFAIIYTVIFEAAWLYFLYASGYRKQH